MSNLESLVSQYQEVRKVEGKHRAGAPHAWKSSVIRNYKKLLWTSEGGNIDALRNMLQMHVESINVMVQALQRYAAAGTASLGAHNALDGPLIGMQPVISQAREYSQSYGE